jgi:hypothetical protein
MSRLLRVCLVAIALTSPALRAQAQGLSAPTSAFGIGWSPAAGLIGVEFVNRSFTRAPRLGGAAGIGLAGTGARLNVSLRNPAVSRRVPYLGLGYVAAPWLPILKMSGAASVEGGVQIWPSEHDGLYLDVGAGIAVLTGASSTTGPVLRLLVGHTL